MKKISIATAYKSLLLFILSFSQALAWAQDSSASSNAPGTTKTVTTTEFVVQPWMWIAGGVVVLILLIILFTGNSNKKEVAVTKTTVIRETEIR